MTMNAIHAEKGTGETNVSSLRVSSDDNGPVSKVALDASASRDAQEMALMGKVQQLKRNFGFWSILGFSATLMVTWEGILCVFVYGLTDGGPAGLVYGFIFCWLGYLAVVASMAELVSMSPVSGGQYHWVHQLAPPKWKNFLSYITGWQSVIAWQAVLASAGYLAGTILQGLLILAYPDGNFTRWQGTLLVFAVMIFALVFNTLLASQLPKVESAILFLHIVGFFCILGPLVHYAPHGSASDVFQQFLNGGGYDSLGLTFFVGIITSVYAFLGADGAVHMCEEIANASTVVPRSMIISIALNGALGFSMLIAVLFCIGDISTALGTNTGFPFIEIISQAVQNLSGSTAMVALIEVLVIFATVAMLCGTSRMTWAFARDRGLPGSRWLSRVEPRTQLPLYSIGLSTLITCLLSLINIGSAIAFNAIISLVVAGFLGSYLLPFGLFLYQRLRHPELVHYGPWNLGKFGVVVNVFALIWTIIAMFFSFWPIAIPVAPETMNWSCLLYGFTVLFACVFWFAYGKKRYTGPVVEVIVEDIRHGVV